jgi:hypothetical protein
VPFILKIWWLVPLILDFIFSDLRTCTFHNNTLFRLGFAGRVWLYVDWKLSCSETEKMSSFCVQVKSVGELIHFPPMGIGSADSSRLPKGGIAWPIPTDF